MTAPEPHACFICGTAEGQPCPEWCGIRGVTLDGHDSGLTLTNTTPESPVRVGFPDSPWTAADILADPLAPRGIRIASPIVTVDLGPADSSGEPVCNAVIAAQYQHELEKRGVGPMDVPNADTLRAVAARLCNLGMLAWPDEATAERPADDTVAIDLHVNDGHYTILVPPDAPAHVALEIARQHIFSMVRAKMPHAANLHDAVTEIVTYDPGRALSITLGYPMLGFGADRSMPSSSGDAATRDFDALVMPATREYRRFAGIENVNAAVGAYRAIDAANNPCIEVVRQLLPSETPYFAALTCAIVGGRSMIAAAKNCTTPTEALVALREKLAGES